MATSDEAKRDDALKTAKEKHDRGADASTKGKGAKVSTPGAGLKKADKDAHDATYDENGDLKVKTAKPVAAVHGGEVGSADTGVKAKIHEPVSGETVNPIDTVDREAMNEEARKAERPAQVEDEDGERHVDEAQEAADEKAKEETLKAAGADDTEAAKNAEKSQAENKKEQKAQGDK